MGSGPGLPPRHPALRSSRPPEDQILPEPCRMDALELEGEHKPEPARRGVELDEAADFPPGAFKPARTEMKRAEQAHLPLGFNPFRYDSFRWVDDAESEAGVGCWKRSTQAVGTVGVRPGSSPERAAQNPDRHRLRLKQASSKLGVVTSPDPFVRIIGRHRHESDYYVHCSRPSAPIQTRPAGASVKNQRPNPSISSSPGFSGQAFEISVSCSLQSPCKNTPSVASLTFPSLNKRPINSKNASFLSEIPTPPISIVMCCQTAPIDNPNEEVTTAQ